MQQWTIIISDRSLTSVSVPTADGPMYIITLDLQPTFLHCNITYNPKLQHKMSEKHPSEDHAFGKKRTLEEKLGILRHLDC